MSENRLIDVEERGATHILFYSICVVVPVFITGIRIKENKFAFFTSMYQAENVHVSCCFIQNWEAIESLKTEKSPGILFSHFRTYYHFHHFFFQKSPTLQQQGHTGLLRVLKKFLYEGRW